VSIEISKRKYELRKRAEAMADTRRRITEATVELHGTVGPARTTVSAVAERAGVQRHTVYRHFPDEDTLVAACSSHFFELHPLPETAAWRRERDPAARLETALVELYRYYDETAYMWTNILRDAELVPSIMRLMPPFERRIDEMVRVLASGWGARGTRRRLVVAAIGHAIDFRTWESLVRRGGISAEEGAELMRTLVESARG
jgi:AcrR family transcriptional regulator